MKKQGTKLLGLLLSLIMTMQMLPLTVFAAELQEDKLEAQLEELQESLDTLNAELQDEEEEGPQLLAAGSTLPSEKIITERMAVELYYEEPFKEYDWWEEVYVDRAPGDVCELSTFTLDLADPDNVPKLTFKGGYRDPNNDYEFVPFTEGTFEILWCYELKSGGVEAYGMDVNGERWYGGIPIGMSEQHFYQLRREYVEDNPDDYNTDGLWESLDSWTTDTTVPPIMTLGELRGEEADYYVGQYELVYHMRFTPPGEEEPIYYENDWNAYGVEVINSNGYAVDEWTQFVPTVIPSHVDAVPHNFLTQEDIPYGTVEAMIGEKYTPVTFYGRMWSEEDGYNDMGAFGGNARIQYVWMTVEEEEDVPRAITSYQPDPASLKPVGMPMEEWQGYIDDFRTNYPDAYAAGDYSILYESLMDGDYEGVEYDVPKGLPLFPEALQDEYQYEWDWEPTDKLADYAEHTYVCLIRWSLPKYDEELGWTSLDPVYGYSYPITVTPVINPAMAELDEGYPLPEWSRTALDGSTHEWLECTASYGLTPLSYQWYRSETPEYNGVAMTDDYAHDAKYQAAYPTGDQIDTIYYYYCEYSFANKDGETETHRTNIAALERMGTGELDITVEPGEMYLGELPGNTDGFEAHYIRFQFVNENLPVWDPKDSNIPWAYQVVGEENTISAWIDPEYSMKYCDTLTYQWYKSSTYDYTEDPNCEEVGEEGTVTGLAGISLSRYDAAGTTVLRNLNALNQHANIHVEVTAEDMEPFYMTAVVTAHNTDGKGVEHTWSFSHTCKIIPVEKNEDLYQIDKDGVITGYSGHQATMVLPAEIGGKTVTSVGRLATYANGLHSYPAHVAGARKIVVSEGIPEIGDSAFVRLLSVEEVVLPEGLVRIGENAFRDAGWIKSLQLPASLESIGFCAFDRSRIQEVIFDKNTWPLLEGGVFHKSRIAHVVFPEVPGELAVTDIGGGRADNFYDCKYLQRVDNHQNITNLDRDANFLGAPAYEYLVPGGGGGADSTMIYELNADGQSYTAIKAVDPQVEHLVIPATFNGLPVTGIGRGHGTDGASNMSSAKLVTNPETLKSVVIPDSVTTINDYAFEGCENLVTFTFHDKITEVGDFAFNNCKRMTSDVILAPNAKVWRDAFYNCWSIRKLNAPDAQLWSRSFDRCFSLVEKTETRHLLPELAEGETSYGERYYYSNFWGSKLYSDYEEDHWVYRSPTNGSLVDVYDKIGQHRVGNIIYTTEDGKTGVIDYYIGVHDTQITLPSKVTGPYGEISLTKVDHNVFDFMLPDRYEAVFSEGITTLVGYGTDHGGGTEMGGLWKVTLPNSLTEISNFFGGNWAEPGAGIEEIVIPANVEYLDTDYYFGGQIREVGNVFAYCPNLKKVSFAEGSKLKKIGRFAFAYCPNLTEFDFANLTFCESIGKDAFCKSSLTSADLSSMTSLKTIEAGAFFNLDMTEIILPEGLETIGDKAFVDPIMSGDTPVFDESVDSLDPLQELVLPSTLKYIGKEAFAGQFLDNTANDPYVLQLPDGLEVLEGDAFAGRYVACHTDMEVLSNVALPDGKLPEGLKIFGTDDQETYAFHYDSPFAYTPITKLIFPAGIEMLGRRACAIGDSAAMNHLNTIVFLTEEVTVADGEEPIQTSNLRRICEEALNSYYDFYNEDVNTPIYIIGFENLHKLESIGYDVFGDTHYRWTNAPETYTLPETLRYLGVGALSCSNVIDGEFSAFKHIIIPEGLETIAGSAISCNSSEDIVRTITALGKDGSLPELDDQWLNYDWPYLKGLATLYCYFGSVYHKWAIEHDYPYVLLDAAEGAIMLNLVDSNGSTVASKDYLESITWTNGAGEVVGTGDVLRNAVVGEAYTVTAKLLDAQSWDYILPITSATVIASAEGNAIRLPLQELKEITLTGTFKDHKEPGFKATLQGTYAYYGQYPTIKEITEINADGSFSVKIPKRDARLYLEVGEASVFKATTLTGFMWLGRLESGVLDLGEIEMDRKGPETKIPVAADLSECTNLKVTTEKGDTYGVFYSGGYLHISGVEEIGVQPGDKLTLTSSASSYATRILDPYEFTVPYKGMAETIHPTVKEIGNIAFRPSNGKGCLYVYDPNGDLVTVLYNEQHINVKNGTYTLVAIEKKWPYNTLDGFHASECHSANYKESTITIENNKAVYTEATPAWFNVANHVAVSMYVDEKLKDGEGNVPVFISFSCDETLGDGTLSLEIAVDKDEVPFAKVNGEYAFIDQEEGIKDVTIVPGGGHVRGKMTLSTTAKEGTICFYAKATGDRLTLKLDGKAIQSVSLPHLSFTLSQPKNVTDSAEGTVTLIADTRGGGYKAVVMVDGEAQKTVMLTSNGKTSLPYTFKTYNDGSSRHTLQVKVLDPSGEICWISDTYSIIHTKQTIPEPQKLDVRITNENVVWQDGRTDSVDGVNHVEKASYDITTGQYTPMKYVVPYWNYNDDGTMSKGITLDYALTVKNRELITDDQITLLVYCNENETTIHEVDLHWNSETGTYDGTLYFEANSITVEDLPFGFDLRYSTEVAIEEKSRTGIEKAAEKIIAGREDVFAENTWDYPVTDMDAANHFAETYLQELTAEQRAALLRYYELNNQVAAFYKETEEAFAKLALQDTVLPSDSSEIEKLQHLYAARGVKADVMSLEGEAITEEELLNEGFEKYTVRSEDLYVRNAGETTTVIRLDQENPANSYMFISGNQMMMLSVEDVDSTQRALIGGAKAAVEAVMEAILTEEAALQAWEDLYSKIEAAQDDLDALDAETKAKIEDMYNKANESADLPAEYKDPGDFKSVDEFYDEMKNSKAKVDDSKKAIDEAIGLLDQVMEAMEKGDFKTAGKLVEGIADITTGLKVIIKVLPGVGAIVSGLLAIVDYIGLVNRADDVYGVIDDARAAGSQRRSLYEEAYNKGCLKEGAFGSLEECAKAHTELLKKLKEFEADADTYFQAKSFLLAVDIETAIASLVPGLNLVSAGISAGSALGGAAADITFDLDINEMTDGINLYQDRLEEMCDLSDIDLDCWDEEPEDPDGPDGPNDPNDPNDPGNPWKPKVVVDPSGYVYEAVASNRIEGATAKVYYKDDAGNEVFWDEAPDYEEINPQTTDSYGAYGWMTPPGYWKVRITKDGYLPADSENDPAANAEGWLPVPPPQLNVNIPLISTAAPKVESAAVAADQVRVVFSQYMDIAAFTEEMVTVKQNGIEIPVNFEFVDAEESPTQPSVFYGRILKLVKADGTAFSGSGFTVTVEADAKNYAAKSLGTTYTSPSMTAAQILGTLEHTYPNRYVTEISATQEIVVVAKGTDGKPMAGVAVSASQAFGGTLEMNTSAVTDAQGRAVFTVKGISGGSDVITFTAGVVSVDMNTRVDSVDLVKPKKPTANLNDFDTVASGTQLILECATEGAVIYYTTDNTCPCTDSPNRKVYTGPVEITENTLFRIASWTEAGGYSERLNLRIYVTGAFSVDAVVSGTTCNVALNNAPTGSIMYCASYTDGGKMLAVEEWMVSGSTHSFTVHEDADYVKVFMVECGTYKPITQDRKIPVAK